jgi:hypothetical protein
MEARAAHGPLSQPTPGSPPRLDLLCASEDDCPASVGMVVFPGADAPERCTGTLVRGDVVLTAGHCVAPSRGGRRVGATTEGWVAFPGSGAFPARWHQVAEVLAITDGEGAVLAEDHALLRLAEPTRRPAARITTDPPEVGSIVRVALVTPDPIYATQHRLETRLCRVADGRAAEDALGPGARRVGWLSGCPILPGNSGSPVLDSNGRIRALVHGGSHPFFGIGVTSRPPVIEERPTLQRSRIDSRRSRTTR